MNTKSEFYINYIKCVLEIDDEKDMVILSFTKNAKTVILKSIPETIFEMVSKIGETIQILDTNNTFIKTFILSEGNTITMSYNNLIIKSFDNKLKIKINSINEYRDFYMNMLFNILGW